MQKVLLTSEAFIKGASNIDDNMQPKFLIPAIKESQDIDVQQVLGTPLLNKLCDLVSGSTIDNPENIAYKALIDKVQYFMLYCVLSKICVIANIKIGNIGVYSTNDENAYSVNLSNMFTTKDYYEKKADYYKMLLQQFLIENHADYPELTEAKCTEIHSNLYSAASSGLWLGGARGRGRRRGPTFGFDKYYD